MLVLYELLFKYSEKPAPSEGTARAHSCIIEKIGYTWIGKFGKRISARSKQILLNQVESTGCFSYMVKRGGNRHIVHGLRTLDVQFGSPTSGTYPSYYTDKGVGLWIKTDKIFELNPSVLSVLIGKSSRLPINITIDKTQSSTIFVCRNLSVDIELEYSK